MDWQEKSNVNVLLRILKGKYPSSGIAMPLGSQATEWHSRVARQSDRSRQIDARNQLISMMSSRLTSYRERLIDPCEQEIIRILYLTIRHSDEALIASYTLIGETNKDKVLREMDALNQTHSKPGR